MLRHIILGVLRQGGVKHGYAVMKEIRDRAGLRVSIGNVYRELKRLETEGLVRNVPNPPGVDPRRAPFESTPVGVSVFDGWIISAHANALPDYRDEFCLRAMFIEDSGREVARAVLDRWREELALHSRALERCQERALARRDGESGFANAWVDYQLKTMNQYGYDGVWADNIICAWNVGTSWSTVPVNPRTGALYTMADYRRDLGNALGRIHAKLEAAGKKILGNHGGSCVQDFFNDQGVQQQ